jgi:hypothetical protein
MEDSSKKSPAELRQAIDDLDYKLRALCMMFDGYMVGESDDAWSLTIQKHLYEAQGFVKSIQESL